MSASSLRGVKKDIELFEQLCKKQGISNIIIGNNTKDGLFKQLDIVREYILKKKPEQVLLVYSGHGYEDPNNMIAGINTEDGKKVNLPEITAYFSTVPKLYLVFDACRALIKDVVNYDKIVNDFVIIITATEQACNALTVSSGSFFLASFFDIFDTALQTEPDNIGVGFMLIVIESTFTNYIKKGKGTPNMYANKGVRERDPTRIDRILLMTKQTRSDIAATKINVAADKHSKEYEIKQKIKECDERKSRINLLLNQITELNKKGDTTLVVDIGRDLGRLESKHRNCRTELKLLENELKNL